jgi:serine/threonine-protein kinase RsbT
VDGYSTGGGLGSGLPSVRRLMDEFGITSRPAGTRVVARKWPTTHR